MKKNKMMRIASVLLVAVLLSTSVISGTFAKYTTSETGSDSARVAKWGIQITTVSDNMFKETYAKTENTTFDNTVIATGDVVAPGTDGSMTFTITGTPEVAFKLTFEMSGVGNDELKDVVIPSGTEIADNNTLNEDYTPVKFTLKKGNEVVDGAEDVTLATIAEKFNALTAEHAANVAINDTYTLSWAWAISENDVADTYLGNVAAGLVTNAATTTDIAFEFTITATQID